jgi:AbrB family transcriptional regulator (stage V sporulation protein T)
MTYQAKVIAGGKVVIPADLRRELGIKDGDSLVVERDPAGGIVLKTYAQVVEEVQARFRELRNDLPAARGSVVDELLAERREEGFREQAKFDAWVAE